ncbi:hypothetical protein HDU81_008733 [Chytriomyces hyalinus]|nr:hypothetical protein HDU81_008733 [Chytriomyces hyalinus]
MSFGCDTWTLAQQTTIFNNNTCIIGASMKQCSFVTNGILSFFLFGRQQLALVKASNNSSQQLGGAEPPVWQYTLPDKKMELPVIFVESDRWGVIDELHSDRRVYFKVDQGHAKGLCLQPKQPLLALLSNTGSTLWDVDSAGSMPFNSESSSSSGFYVFGNGNLGSVYYFAIFAAVCAVVLLGLCCWQYKVRKQRGKPSQPLSIALQSISVVNSTHAGKMPEANQSVAHTESPAATGAKRAV